jgi:hypothetical protein
MFMGVALKNFGAEPSEAMAGVIFCTQTDGVTMGEKSERKRGATTFEFWLSLFADDCALFFNTRSGLIHWHQLSLQSSSQVRAFSCMSAM